MRYKITELTQKIGSNGKPFAKTKLQDESGVLFNVNIFEQPFMLAVGQELEGSVYTNDKGYTNFKAGSANSSTTPKTGFGQANMQQKAESIKIAQERKDESIKTSSTFRDATLIAVEFFKKNPDMTELEFNSKWLSIRKWLWENFEYDETGNSIPF